jgi:hypothetical protein
VFEIASRQDKPWPGTLRSIAYVDVNRDPGTLMQFAGGTSPSIVAFRCGRS